MLDTPLPARRWESENPRDGREELRGRISPGRRTGEPLPVRRGPQGRHGARRLCEVVEIARSSFYAGLDAAPRRAAKAARDAALASRIRVLQDPAQGGDRAYGAPRIAADLNAGVTVAERVNHERVARRSSSNSSTTLAPNPSIEWADTSNRAPTRRGHSNETQAASVCRPGTTGPTRSRIRRPEPSALLTRGGVCYQAGRPRRRWDGASAERAYEGSSLLLPLSSAPGPPVGATVCITRWIRLEGESRARDRIAG